MATHGVPEAILTDNGKVFTARFGPGPGPVRFDRICTNNGITHILTAPRSPSNAEQNAYAPTSMPASASGWPSCTASSKHTTGPSTSHPAPPAVSSSRFDFPARRRHRPRAGPTRSLIGKLGAGQGVWRHTVVVLVPKQAQL